jgi:hypothetical protein
MGRYEKSEETGAKSHLLAAEPQTLRQNGWRQCKNCRRTRTVGQCSECDDPATRGGVCGKHYMRWHRSTRTEEQRAERRKKDAAQAREKRRRLRAEAQLNTGKADND